MVRRREEDMDDEGVLQRRARPAWQLLALVATIAVGLTGLVAWDARAAAAAAREVTEARVAPVERRLDDHLAQSKALREVMDRYVLEQRDLNRTISAKLDALCRANPRADCPLGGP